MSDVARYAEVSRVTVSKFLNGSGNVRPEHRRRIEQACAQLGYVRNESAVGLVRGHSQTLGVIVPALAETFYSDLLVEMDAAARSAGYALLIQCSDNSPRREDIITQSFLALQVAALLVVPAGHLDEQRAIWLASRKRRVVFLDSVSRPDALCVMNHHQAALTLAVQHLIAQGQSPWLLGLPNVSPVAHWRATAYRSAMEDAGLAPRALPMEGFTADWNLEATGYAAVKSALNHGESMKLRALVCANDALALGAYRALFEAGLRVGHDVLVTGHDDQKFAAYLTPPLTTVRQASAAIARSAIQLAIDTEGRAVNPRTILHDATLIVRRSA